MTSAREPIGNDDLYILVDETRHVRIVHPDLLPEDRRRRAIPVLGNEAEGSVGTRAKQNVDPVDAETLGESAGRGAERREQVVRIAKGGHEIREELSA